MKRLPHIGMRMVKSAIAVFLCLCIQLLRNGEGVVFYSCIAAILCIQPDSAGSVRIGKNRIVGTLIGGLCGMALLAGEPYLPVAKPLLHDALVSFGVIIVLYITVLLKKTNASYISCVVFLSIVVAHGADGNPYQFALARMLDTLIGIGVSFLVNVCHVPHRRRLDTLYICDFAHTLLDAENKVNRYAVIRIRQLLERGICLSFSALLPPAFYKDALDAVSLPVPLITLFGSALYDPRQKRYEVLGQLDAAASRQLLAAFHAFDVLPLVFYTQQQMLRVQIDGAWQEQRETRELIEAIQQLAAHTCVYGPLPSSVSPLAIAAYAQTETLTRLRRTLDALAQHLGVSALLFPAAASQTHSFLLLVSADCSPDRAARCLQQRNAKERLCVISAGAYDIPLLKKASEAYVLKGAPLAMQAYGKSVESILGALQRSFFGKRKE